MLKEKEDEWWKIPIFLKATGGMRELPLQQREAIMEAVRSFLLDQNENPFHFEPYFARVISGEEEGIYAWASVNFFMNTLLLESQGEGTAEPALTYGALDMGGASTQISFFVESQDIAANLFKLQVGKECHRLRRRWVRVRAWLTCALHCCYVSDWPT